MNKKILSAIMIGSMIGTNVITMMPKAVTGEKAITVTYDNQTAIPDPENPNNPQWQVVIPSAITFTDDRRMVDADLKLEALNGGDLSRVNVNVKVKSKNGYKLTLGSNEAKYTLAYGNTVLDDSTGTGEEQIATLSNSKTEERGTARLVDTVNATKSGKYTDVLTYIVEKQG